MTPPMAAQETARITVGEYLTTATAKVLKYSLADTVIISYRPQDLALLYLLLREVS